MLDSLMLRSGYGELAKAIHSSFASITTVFLLTRIWSRKSQHKGLWWDDWLLVAAWICLLIGNGSNAAAPSYGFNIITGTPHGWRLVFTSITCFYIGGAFAKTAFGVTLLRLSSGRTKILLGAIIVITWAFAITLGIVTWIPICDTKSEEVGLKGQCVQIGTLLWIHIGSTICTIFADVVLSYLPWRILRSIHIPSGEKWGVGSSMSLVGLSALICIVRLGFAGYCEGYGNMPAGEEKKDWSYGAIVIWALLQAEVAVYIIAQVIPLLRVMVLGEGSKASLRPSALAEPARAQRTDKGKSPAIGLGSITEVGVELVQLSSGKIVPADSEEARIERETTEASKREAQTPEAIVPSEPPPQEEYGGPDLDDEVHRKWSDMGLSRRAWSKTPSPPMAPARLAST
ncbi:hypothetical protein N0V93_005271 [Gnomoniopsis smithogilvyi]|uniref:Rhodopsin domain-containing protein n=1 Tax=Gnomoniopsis smithogilvyi TaxID=1191159 RepID=A0A9W9CWK8_9PEZI|nr:hypothetical protein N0V93_005271 [Gnomoniopsis smithogilvyi]